MNWIWKKEDLQMQERRKELFLFREPMPAGTLINGDPRLVFVSPPQAQQDWMKLRVPFRKWLEINREK